MRETEVHGPQEFQYYVTHDGQHYDYSKPRSQGQLQADINVAHDNLKKLVVEKDRLNTRLAAAQHRLRNANLKIWFLGFLVMGQGAVLGWIVKVVLPLIPFR